MVVATGADEGGLGAKPLLQLEPEHTDVEVERPVEVGDLEVDVADVDPGVDRLGLAVALLHGGEATPRRAPG